jgi:hypothetical protein
MEGSAMANIKKQRALLVLGLLLVLLGGFALFVHTCVAIHITPSGHGECISISFFEKYTPENVDKIVIKAQGQKVVITDPALIRELVSETAIATHANIGHAEQRHIYVYSGDQLLRSMAWGVCCDTVTVYEADSTHWMLAPEPPVTGNRGCVYLSNELAAKLNALLGENQT